MSIGELFRFWIMKSIAEMALGGIILAACAVAFLVVVLVLTIKDKCKKRKEKKE